jgi:hypothetical protein
MIKAVITFVLANYTLGFFIIGLVVSGVAIMRSSKPVDRTLIVEKLLAWYVFFSIGIGNFYNFIIHGLFGEMSARFTGSADSPFQFEVGTASLAFAVVGLLAAFRSFNLRLAAIIGPSVFTLGAAVGQVYQMVTAQSFASGNAGIVFWTDVGIPLFGFALCFMVPTSREAHPWFRSRWSSQAGESLK